MAAGDKRTQNITLNVLFQEGDFEVIAPEVLNVKAGQGIGLTVNVIPLLGFNKSVKLDIAGGPAGMTVEWQDGIDIWTPGRPEPDNLACDITIPMDNSLVGSYPLVLTGTELA